LHLRSERGNHRRFFAYVRSAVIKILKNIDPVFSVGGISVSPVKLELEGELPLQIGNIQIGKNTTYFVNKSKASASRSADSGTAEKYGFSVGEKGVTEYDGAIISKAHPSQSVYTDGADGTDILTVKWNGENSSQDRRFKFTVTGKGTSDEKVTEMIFPDGTSMSLEGF